jgi:bacterioferritin-associated ferredoxin
MDDDKIVCGCINVTVKDLKDAIANGAKSFEEVQSVTKVGTGCGNCVDGVKVLVDELLAK